DPFHPPVPFGIEFFLIQLQPGLERSQATDYFFFSNFHWAAHGAFAWTAIQKGGFNQVLSTQEQATTLGPGQTFATGKTVKVNSHFGVEFGIVSGWNARSIV